MSHDSSLQHLIKTISAFEHTMLHTLLPANTAKHLVNAKTEVLLAAKSAIDESLVMIEDLKAADFNQEKHTAKKVSIDEDEEA
jgi:hypothetical protein